MPTIKDFGAFKIAIYFGDENPPRFHVIAGDEAAKLNIRTLEIIAGSLPRKVLRTARQWAEENRELLLTIWNDQSK